MKQEWDLKNAFPSMPEDCHDALMRAARSVKEEEPMKRFSVKTVLIAALVLIAGTAAALAASDLLGWSDFFSAFGYRIEIPRTARNILTATEEKTYRVGPLTLTVNQLMTDGRIAVCSAPAETADKSPAVISSEIYDAIGANGANGQAAAERMGVDSTASWIDAAHQLKLPFYRVTVYMDVEEKYHHGDDMGDTLWDEKNRCVSYSLVSLNEKNVQDQLPVKLTMLVTQYDAESIEPPAADWASETFAEVKEIGRWRESRDITLPVPAPLQQKTYAPDAPFSFANGMTLNGVRADLTVAGAYVVGLFTLEEGKDFYEAYDGEMDFLDQDGQPIPWGMAESGIIEYDHLPQVEWSAMLNLESLPDTLTVVLRSGGTVQQVSVHAQAR